MPTTVDHFTTAREAALATARGLARTIADTLTALYPGANYLVLSWDEDDDVVVQSIRAPGRRLRAAGVGAPVAP
ncbi:hypothetical protein [Streptomyces sp. WM6378]|uniref:hypothetical protein n=1 Tax=Streptomyces sp. WM6378 TaxID=1415557 RepID=UPI0006ADF3C6|nr:hypothetical protein [Streptomyces sp. WM6378]KOU53149.1 hypothetical protein ADK54_05330 [Streptomyces sp. WM6378]